ncbi:MAG: hypothetical protein LUD76_07140, partial [Alistipes sp.]|nr:hypothetical protein [Alistipes sp.]
MYRRFLQDQDYPSIISQETLNQMTRGNTERFAQAEESAEMSIIERLSENYEIERELNKGKYIAEYDRRITFPIGAHFRLDGVTYEVIRSISGYKIPSVKEYWEEYHDLIQEVGTLPGYSQFGTFRPGDIVRYNDIPYRCLSENGYDFGQIRIPGVAGWLEVCYSIWQPVEYGLWEIVDYEGEFYTLITVEGFDNNLDPKSSDCWGAIADYNQEYNGYELSDHEYVVYSGRVFCPEIDVNADQPIIGENIVPRDPRHYNLKKHMVRLALYELTKLISPNNVSVVRVKDYEDSMRWLGDAARLK